MSREIFYIDIGDVPKDRAIAFLEQIKAEITNKSISGLPCEKSTFEKVIGRVGGVYF